MLLKLFSVFVLIFASVSTKQNNTGENVLPLNGFYQTNYTSKKLSIKGDAIKPPWIQTDTFLKVKMSNMILTSGFVGDFPNLEILVMEQCKLRELQPKCFQNLPKLRKLHLQKNKLSEIPSGVFNGLPVETLYLHKNLISVIDSNAFDNMPNLVEIKLNSNRINVLDVGWFKDTPKLNNIYLRRNAIQAIPKGFFKRIGNNADLHIFLSHNEIKQIDAGSFEGLQEIHSLFLDRNSIVKIDNQAFSQVKKIAILNLSKNLLQDVSNTFVNTHIELLDLLKNNLTCPKIEDFKLADAVELRNNRHISCSCNHELKSKAENKSLYLDSCE